MLISLVLTTLLVAPSLGAKLPLIIGGNDVETAGTYPWQGSLTFLGSHSCGCSLLSADWVITAGHCILSPTFQNVVFGVHDIKTRAEGSPQTYKIAKAIVHPDFDMQGDGFPNDVALIKLKSPANLTNEFIDTVPMAPVNATDADYSNCVITGWGATRIIGGIIPTMPDILQEAKVGIYLKDDCQTMWDGVAGATINDGHICVGEKGERGACSGDSGGPLVCQYDGSIHLVGLTSWGLSTCSTDFPSVYTRVSYFREWLDAEMEPAY